MKSIFPFSIKTWQWFFFAKPFTFKKTFFALIYGWHAIWFEINCWLSKQTHRKEFSNSISSSIFICGLWRTGSTEVHRLLAQLPGVDTPRTWQCMAASTFSLTGSPKDIVSLKRPMDSQLIDALSPQEDEFALLSFGVDSCYRGFFEPERLSELQYCLDPEFWLANNDWFETFEKFLFSVIRTKSTPLVKSPNHSFRLKSIFKNAPDSKVVWLVRDPVDTYYSNKKMWLKMMETYSFGKVDSNVLDDFLISSFNEIANVLYWATENIPKDKMMIVAFRDLCVSPNIVLKTICSQLNLLSDAQEISKIVDLIDFNPIVESRYVSSSRSSKLEAAISALAIAQERAVLYFG
ncbi:sulfotransferase family protein [Undibacterium sp. Ji67W]|uniref:sulfotransferase family protein n=1 Tax=Undibacterium sp. Ji67W TaxID=3413042 RepID=UPI003BF212A6